MMLQRMQPSSRICAVACRAFGGAAGTDYSGRGQHCNPQGKAGSDSTQLDPHNPFAGQKVVVVGGSSGIGVAAARGVLMRGGDVVLVSRDASHLAATHNKLAQQLGLRVLDEKHKRIETAVCDSTEESIKQLYAAQAPGTIHHIVVSAGPETGRCADLESTSWTDVKEQLDAKTSLSYNHARYGSPNLTSGGSIVFFSGALGRRVEARGFGLGGANVLNEILAKVLALELGPRIRVNCISPGMVNTSRVGTTDDIGHACSMVMVNNWMTGSVIDVDGGAVLA